jgi:CRISPR-associated Csx2 family protein
MPRRVFISFLGTSNYQPTRYVVDETDEADTHPIRFVQEAIAEKFCYTYRDDDAIYIFTTEGALSNWHDGNHKNFKTGTEEWYEGLKTRLGKLSLQCHVENVLIPDGKSTAEIWGIFKVVYERLEDGDILIFDITHGFRSLPMLNMVLINYAKLLKNISISGIYYGAFDAKYEKGGSDYAPVWDLTDFQVVQEWSNSANIFLKTGNAMPLSQLMEGTRFDTLRTHLSDFSKFTLVNRGMDIYDGSTMVALNEELSKEVVDTATSLDALKPILGRIKDEFKSYRVNSTINGFLAVRWCLQNGLIQQAATLLEEFIITFALVEIGEEHALKDQFKRDTISAALTLGNDTAFKYIKVTDKNNPADPGLWQLQTVDTVRALPYKSRLGRLLYDIKNSIRNDINHAGFRESHRSFDSFEESIIKRYEKTRKLINQLKSIDLPPI